MKRVYERKQMSIYSTHTKKISTNFIESKVVSLVFVRADSIIVYILLVNRTINLSL